MLADFFTVHSLLTLAMLIFLQAVLGFDNLLYISIESRRVAPDKQQYVRRVGIALAIGLRIALLFVIVKVISSFQSPFVTLDWPQVVAGAFNLHSVIVLAGGIFIIYTAFKEIFHMLAIDDLAHGTSDKKRSVIASIMWISVMNLVFSFDSILSAVALTENILVMAVAIIVSGILMIWLADRVSEFLKKNRMYEVLGLFILLIVGVMLVSEGGHLAGLELFGQEIMPMTHANFYFVIVLMVLIDIVQGRYQKKLLRRSAAAASGQPS